LNFECPFAELRWTLDFRTGTPNFDRISSTDSKHSLNFMLVFILTFPGAQIGTCEIPYF
jgi:hypothetical protein